MFTLKHLFCHFRFASNSVSLSMDLPDLGGLRNEDDGSCFLNLLVNLFNPLLVTCKHLNLMELVHSLSTSLSTRPFTDLFTLYLLGIAYSGTNLRDLKSGCPHSLRTCRHSPCMAPPLSMYSGKSPHLLRDVLAKFALRWVLEAASCRAGPPDTNGPGAGCCRGGVSDGSSASAPYSILGCLGVQYASGTASVTHL